MRRLCSGAARCARESAVLSDQRRAATKLASGGMRNKLQKHGQGGPLSKWYGWKIMPGNMAGIGYTIIKVKSYSGVAVAEDDDEMPFNVYPGANTTREFDGRICSTCEGVVRLSKLPGTEGSGEKVFVWVDPHYSTFYKKEVRRHEHREMGREFAVDEVDDRYLMDPHWTSKSTDHRVEQFPEWHTNPEWDLPKEERDYSRRPVPATRFAKTEAQRYEEVEDEMFWSRMPVRERHYRFGGRTHTYDGSRVEPKPVEQAVWKHNALNGRASGPNRLYHPRFAKDAAKEAKAVYRIPDFFGERWLA
eukprot:TRINITY_DN13124_c1_g1_i1.p2 TRINITY_DN13124_c1_g1~~TRINITY_DN13124_c1_g1_i1.p2  ORF type:complete len:304 (+),score=106.56 TRINITY_DN13124_c1_g1_i1:87-998(+)